MAAASQLAKAPGVAALAGAAVLLAILNLQLLRTPVDVSPIAPPARETDAPRPDSGRPATALDTRTAEQFQETVGRPLFNPSRRPVPRKEAAEARPNAGVGDLRLVGVMRAADQPPRALLRSANAANGRWIAEGAEFNGWTLHKVDERSVVLKSGARSQELKLAAPRRAPIDDVPAAKQ
jgi:general secretion pathway protein N